MWYEYVAQTNPSLRKAVDAALAGGGTLDEALTHELFCRHIAEVDPESGQRVMDGFQRVLVGMARSAAQAGDQSARFESSLSRLNSELVGSAAAAAEEALAETRQMQDAVQHLRQRLQESRQEIETLREEVQRARHEALVDSLTGLANRRAFERRLSDCLSATEEPAHAPSLVVSDVDHFKKINDSYGHSFGDDVLRVFANLLNAAAEPKGLAARTGGEEFAILLPATAIDEAHAMAEGVRVRVASSRLRRRTDEKVLGTMTMSFGVTRYRQGETAMQFIERADEALYTSKRDGRNRVTVI